MVKLIPVTSFEVQFCGTKVGLFSGQSDHSDPWGGRDNHCVSQSPQLKVQRTFPFYTYLFRAINITLCWTSPHPLWRVCWVNIWPVWILHLVSALTSNNRSASRNATDQNKRATVNARNQKQDDQVRVTDKWLRRKSQFDSQVCFGNWSQVQMKAFFCTKIIHQAWRKRTPKKILTSWMSTRNAITTPNRLTKCPKTQNTLDNEMKFCDVCVKLASSNFVQRNESPSQVTKSFSIAFQTHRTL